MPQIVLGDNRGGDWPGAGLPAWRPTRGLARKSLAGIPRGGHRKPARRNASAGTPCPELLALLPWERLGEPCNPRTQESQNPGKPSCDIPAGTPDTPGPWGLPEALNGGLGASIKRTPGLVENGPFQGLWGVGPWGGVFFSYGVCPSDSTGQDRVVPRNFTAESGSNGCNNFPTGDRPPLHPPPGCYCK